MSNLDDGGEWLEDGGVSFLVILNKIMWYNVLISSLTIVEISYYNKMLKGFQFLLFPQAANLDSSYCGSLRRFDGGRKRRLPARIVLRPIASYQFLFYLALYYVFASCLWQKLFLVSTFYLLLLGLFYVISKAVVEGLVAEREDQKNNSSRKRVLDLTLDATKLHQDNF